MQNITEENEIISQPLVTTRQLILSEEDDVAYAIILSYNEMFAGKEGYAEPIINEKGSITFSFPNSEEAGNFFMKEAEKGHAFMIVDVATNTVVGYSNGNGNFYHVDGSVFQQGEALASLSGIHPDDFELPRPLASNP